MRNNHVEIIVKERETEREAEQFEKVHTLLFGKVIKRPKSVAGQVVRALGLTAIAGCMVFSPTFASSHFTDIGSGYWANDFITTLAETGVVSGYPDGTYQPGANMKIDEFIALAIKSAGEAPVASSGYWAQGYIDAAMNLGWITPGEFSDYSEKINREQMASIMTHAAADMGMAASGTTNGENAEAAFGDFGHISNRYREAVSNAYDMGLMSGYPDGTFKPEGLTTRAEAAAVLYNMLYPGTAEVEAPADTGTSDALIAGLLHSDHLTPGGADLYWKYYYDNSYSDEQWTQANAPLFQADPFGDYANWGKNFRIIDGTDHDLSLYTGSTYDYWYDLTMGKTYLDDFDLKLNNLLSYWLQEAQDKDKYVYMMTKNDNLAPDNEKTDLLLLNFSNSYMYSYNGNAIMGLVFKLERPEDLTEYSDEGAYTVNANMSTEARFCIYLENFEPDGIIPAHYQEEYRLMLENTLKLIFGEGYEPLYDRMFSMYREYWPGRNIYEYGETFYFGDYQVDVPINPGYDLQFWFTKVK
jgi:hypothetical protein